MGIELVVAAAANGVIGLDGAMPWRMPSDLKTFRRLTMGRPMIMGRRTFEAIGRALDGRTNIVVTRDAGFSAAGTVVAHSFDEALEIARRSPGADAGIMVIGGGQIYASARPLADVIYLTRIEATPDGDTWFADPEPDVWRETARQTIAPDPRDDHAAVLIRFERIAPAPAS